jgi:hypothetical protein
LRPTLPNSYLVQHTAKLTRETPRGCRQHVRNGTLVQRGDEACRRVCSTPMPAISLKQPT